MSRNCKVISVYFGTRRRYPYNSKDAIDVMTDVMEHERTMDPGVDNLDVILVNHDCGSIEGNNYLESINGTEVVAISDLYEDLAQRSKQNCIEIGLEERHKDIQIYSGSDQRWKLMLEEVNPDIVFISDPK